MHESLFELLSMLRCLHLELQTCHWTASGPNFWSLHQMYEEMYTKTATEVDDLAEKILSTLCIDSVKREEMISVHQVNRIRNFILQFFANDSLSPLDRLITFEKRIVESIRLAMENHKDCMDISTRNLLEDLSDSHMQNTYHLKQTRG